MEPSPIAQVLHDTGRLSEHDQRIAAALIEHALTASSSWVEDMREPFMAAPRSKLVLETPERDAVAASFEPGSAIARELRDAVGDFGRAMYRRQQAAAAMLALFIDYDLWDHVTLIGSEDPRPTVFQRLVAFAGPLLRCT
jgi:hypothetical protein